MEAAAAIQIIRQCFDTDRFAVKPHFLQRMDERGLFWPDIQAVVDKPTEVKPDGQDDYGRPRWFVAGNATGDLHLKLLCVFDTDEEGNRVVLITIYWDK